MFWCTLLSTVGFMVQDIFSHQTFNEKKLFSENVYLIFVKNNIFGGYLIQQSFG